VGREACIIMDLLETFTQDQWQGGFSSDDQQRACENLESGRVLYFPRLAFTLSESEITLFDKQWDTRSKNISYEPGLRKLKGVEASAEEKAVLAGLTQRFADTSQQMLHQMLPGYRAALSRARTSFRPVEIAGRASSYRKDDTRLHVDAFPSRPTGGSRILRIFSNVNPWGVARAWRLGEPFDNYARYLLPRIPRPAPGSAVLLDLLGITKGRRTLYDHYMLQLHDCGKDDLDYQQQSPQMAFDFPAGSTWVVFTDQVLHAAHGGQYLLEQTFHLPVTVQAHPERSPLRVLEALTCRPLV
jgi:hypothetical protein